MSAFKFKPGQFVRHKWKPKGKWKVVATVERTYEPFGYGTSPTPRVERCYLLSKKERWDCGGRWWPEWKEFTEEDLEAPDQQKQ